MLSILILSILPLVISDTNITNCSYINNSGTYLLNNNIANSSSATNMVNTSGGNYACFILNTSDIIFDCQNKTVDGVDSDVGFWLNGFDNTTIQNCLITDFTVGINAYTVTGSDDIKILNTNVSSVTQFSIYLRSGQRATIDHVITSGGQYGINDDSYNYVNVTNSQFNGHSTSGIKTLNSVYWIIDNSSASSNSLSGFGLSGDNITVIRSNSTSNTNGFTIIGTINITQSRITDNSVGFVTSASTTNYIWDNFINQKIGRASCRERV